MVFWLSCFWIVTLLVLFFISKISLNLWISYKDSLDKYEAMFAKLSKQDLSEYLELATTEQIMKELTKRSNVQLIMMSPSVDNAKKSNTMQICSNIDQNQMCHYLEVALTLIKQGGGDFHQSDF